MTKLLSKAAILAADDKKFEDVEVPAWGGTVRIAAMSGLARDEWRAAIQSEDGEETPVSVMEAALLAATCIDESGERLFSIEDIQALQAKSGAALDVAASVAMRLNGLGPRAVEVAEKNSDSDQSA